MIVPTNHRRESHCLSPNTFRFADNIHYDI
jgi:hypothetical protein